MSADSQDHRLFCFGDFTLDLDRGALRHGDADIELRPQSFRVLQILLENHGRLVEKKHLQVEIWGNVAVTDDSLTHCLIDIRKAIGDTDRCKIRTVPRRGYLFDIPVKICSHSEAASTANRGRYWLMRGSLLAVLVLVMVAGFWLGVDRKAVERVSAPLAYTPPLNSIAVLPFIDLSENQNQKFFGEALSEEILNLLSRTPKLHIVARTSSFSFRDANPDIQTIARKLNVAYVLEGSTRSAGDHIRVTAQFIDARDGSQVWSQTYDRDLGNLLDIQTEVARRVAKSLQVSLSNEKSPANDTDPVTFSLFARARYLLHQMDPAGKPEAVALLEQVVARDPEFIRGATELARAYYQQSLIGQLTDTEARRRSDRLILMALKMDPDDAVANAWLGWREIFINMNVPAAVDRYRRAIDTEPTNLDILRGATVVLTTLGKTEEAVSLGEYVLAHDPLCEICRINLIFAYQNAGYLDKSEDQIRLIIDTQPQRKRAFVTLAETLLLKGNPQEAMNALAQSQDEGRFRMMYAAIALYRLERRGEFERVFQLLRDNWGESRPENVAEVYAAIGDYESAFTWLGKWEKMEKREMYVYKNPFLVPLHDDSRWDKLLATAGLSEQQLAALDLQFALPL